MNISMILMKILLVNIALCGSHIHGLIKRERTMRRKPLSVYFLSLCLNSGATSFRHEAHKRLRQPNCSSC